MAEVIVRLADGEVRDLQPPDDPERDRYGVAEAINRLVGAVAAERGWRPSHIHEITIRLP